MAVYTFLAINDFELEAPEPEAVSVTLAVAKSSAPEGELAEWIRSRKGPSYDPGTKETPSPTIEPLPTTASDS